MKTKNAIIYLILLIIVSSLLPVPCIAAQGKVIDVERCVPESFSVGEMNEIKLNISGEEPFIIGIVETIPQGYSFPENDEDVSDSEYYKLDRETGKITFAVNSENEVTYKVIPSEEGGGAFEGYWADMLLQSTELNQGKNMWVSVTGPDAVSRDSDGGDVTQTDESTSAKGIGFVILFGLIILIVCFFIWKKCFSGGSKK